MGAGQHAFAVAADVHALDALAAELAVQELSRGAAHAQQLRTLLRMHAVGCSARMEIATVPHAALALGCSEHRAGRLLDEALALGELPGALEAVECGLLGVEQSAAVVSLLRPLAFQTRRLVWERLQARLVLEADRASVLPPARLSELLRRWVQQADPAAAAERRRQAEAGRRVDYRRRDDGLGDLFAFGFTGPDLQAVASRIRDRSAPVGSDDERTADQRRFDAFKDLLLGRDPLPLAGPLEHCDGGRAGCGCLPGSPVPCGAEVLVHLPIGTGLGCGDDPAELVGHGPLDADLLEQVLLSAPRLRQVWTDQHGVPVAVGDQVVVPQRGDPASVRVSLLHLAGLAPPTTLHPRHPCDHGDPRRNAREGHRPTGPPTRRTFSPAAAELLVGQHDPATEHPAGSPGSYRVPRRLRRLLDVRSPRCEWPGCGARASRCDAEHDTAWPEGPTCACNLGPCCRRHHRVKQLGWAKARGEGSAVVWTSPGGAGTWLSRAQHSAPVPATRPVVPVPRTNPFDELSPLEQQHLLWEPADRPDDPAALELRALDATAETADILGEHLRTGDTRWTLDLDDPYLWHDRV